MRRQEETREPDETGRMPYPRFVALAVGILLALWTAGYLPTRRLAGDAALEAMLLGGGLALAASLVGALPLLGKRGRPAVDKVPVVLGGIALRLVIVLGIALLVVLAGFPAREPFLAWVILSHVALLVADTLFARAEMKPA